MFQLIPTDINIDFLKISKPFTWASLLFVALSVVLLFTKGLNYGIDFTGGAEVQISVPQEWDITHVRNALEKGGLDKATVIGIESSRREFLIKTQIEDEKTDIGAQVEKALAAELKPGQYEVEKVDMVGPQAGDELRFSAIFSVLAAALGILIYITFRFDFRFAPGIVRALVFDVITTIGVWILLGKEFNLFTVAALLTIAGYSCNDTVVIYDRIREYSRTGGDLYAIVNRSLNLNLGRTVLTAMFTNFVVVSLWLLGGPVLSDFALVMLIGFTVSIFSTIFVSTPLVMYMEKRAQAKENDKKTGSPEPRHA